MLTLKDKRNPSILNTSGGGHPRRLMGARKKRISNAQMATLKRLKTAAADSLNNNREVLGLQADQPVVTVGAVNTGFTGAYNWAQAANQAKFRKNWGIEYSAGIGRILAVQTMTPQQGSIGASALLTATVPAIGQGAPVGSNPTNDMQHATQSYTLQTSPDCQRVTFELRGSGGNTFFPYRFIVDGQYLNTQGVAVSAGGMIKVDLAWTTPKRRLITIQCQFIAMIETTWTYNGAVLEDINLPYHIRDIAYGDSYVGALLMGSSLQGGTETRQWAGYMEAFGARTAKHSTYTNCGIGGSGYAVGLFGVPVITTEMNLLLTSPPLVSFDRVIFSAGFNDRDSASDAATCAAAQICWTKARARQPNALIVVFGCMGGNRVLSDSSRSCQLDAALKAQFNLWNDPLSIFLPVSPNRADAWTFGDGDESVTPTNLPSNCAAYICDDHIHPTLVGHAYLASKADASYRVELAKLLAKYKL